MPTSPQQGALAPDIPPEALFGGVYPVDLVELAIEYAKSGSQFRIPRSRQGGFWKTVFPSLKVRYAEDNTRDFVKVLEGRLEADYCLIQEFDPEVEAYAVQAFKLVDWQNPTLTSFIPDIVKFRRFAPPVIIDCKPESIANAKIHRQRHDAIRNGLAEHGVAFEVATDTTIRQQPRLDTYKYLYSHLAHNPTQLNKDTGSVLAALKELEGAATVRELRSIDNFALRRGIAHGLATGLLRSDFEDDYGPDFFIELNQTEAPNGC
ncbi:hypothetical protein FHR99_001666 [Litorivivens lipolytica]|uniref:TnsA endonuclease N-terminal domain-containing protein n=1 Tax=Litorivivens lipolytica TaxID=1524264 RepID=A0A7W4W509_9GAMM|nr:hypothetical protein [Litorivivens lipolytica]MBB3047430.1 hypothetical protein [Litorivivens lipolytica]